MQMLIVDGIGSPGLACGPTGRPGPNKNQQIIQAIPLSNFAFNSLFRALVCQYPWRPRQPILVGINKFVGGRD